MGAKGCHRGAGQRRDIDDATWFEAGGVGEGITQYQTALGIGIQYLDGLACHGSDDVTRLGGFAAWHIFDGSDDADDVDRQFQVGAAAHDSDDAGGATHIEFHLIHSRARFETDAAGIEGDALAHEDMGLAIRPGALVLNHDQFGFLGGAGRYREQRAHAQPGHLFLA